MTEPEDHSPMPILFYKKILLLKIDDLIKQATEEKSHYYVGAVLKECKKWIEVSSLDPCGCKEKSVDVDKLAECIDKAHWYFQNMGKDLARYLVEHKKEFLT